MTQSNRIAGGLIDRYEPVGFSFNGYVSELAIARRTRSDLPAVFVVLPVVGREKAVVEVGAGDR